MNTEPANDRADLERLQRGDDAALDRIVGRWEQRLFAHAWRYLRNAEDAREVVVETLVRLHQQRARLRPETNLSAWLFTTLTNLCHNRHRWRRRHPEAELDEAVPAEGAATPREELERDEGLAALGAALDGLPPDLKAAVLLHHYEGWSYREIGALVHCSERGVETRLYRARQLLRDALVVRTPGAAE